MNQNQRQFLDFLNNIRNRLRIKGNLIAILNILILISLWVWFLHDTQINYYMYRHFYKKCLYCAENIPLELKNKLPCEPDYNFFWLQYLNGTDFDLYVRNETQNYINSVENNTK